MTNKEAISIIKIIGEDYTPRTTFQAVNEALDLAIKALEERPTGEWIGIEEYDDYPNKKVCECSECGKMISISHNDFPNFCENCGADMKGGAKE